MSRNSTRNTPSTDVSKVAEWIAARGLSQAKAARLLEIRRATLHNYLKGTVVPSQAKLAGIIAKMEELDSCNPDIIERKENNDSGVLIVDELRSEISKLKRRLLEGRGLVKIIREIAEDEYSNHTRLILPPAPQALGKGTLMVPVVHVSDTQLGKVTNDYDSTVGAKRIRLLAKKVVELIQIQRQHHKIDEIQLYLGGDMVEGETGNYPSQPFDVDCSVIRQAMKHAPDIFEAFVMYLLEHVKKVNIKCVRGNHGRGASRHAVRHTETNWDTVFYWVLHDRLIGSDLNPRKAMRNRVTFEIPEGDQFWVIDRVLGWGNLMVHGDQIRGWAGIPYYGITKKANGWSDAMPKDWDNLFFGHFHTYASGTLNYRRWFCNGTTESSNSYALEELGAAGLPSQRVVFMTEKYGISSDHQVYLTEDGDREQHLPLMKRRMTRALAELGEGDLRKLLEVVSKGSTKGPPKAGK